MSDLPPELLSDVLPHCDGPTLCTLSQLSHSVREAAEELLYNLIHLDSSARCADLIAALEAAPQHAALVRGLRLLGVDDRTLCTDLLCKLPELERLNVTLWCDGFSYPKGVGFPFRLRRLRIFDKSDGLDTDALIKFLDSQSELEVLELVASDMTDRRWNWLCYCAADSDFPQMLPQLTVLQAPLDIIFAFLKSERPTLQTIKAQTTRAVDLAPEAQPEGEDVAQTLCDQIAAAAPNVRALVLGTYDAAGAVRAAASTCPLLSSLELMVYRRGTFDEFVVESQDETPPTIAISQLKRFVLHVVGTPYEETLEPADLHSSFQNKIVPWSRRILPMLEECEMTLHAGEDANPTLYAPDEYMRTPSTYVPDWHVLHKEFCDQEFFCSN